MGPTEFFATKEAAWEAVMAETKRAVFARVRTCIEIVGGKGRFNVTEYKRERKVVKRYRWKSGEVA